MSKNQTRFNFSISMFSVGSSYVQLILEYVFYKYTRYNEKRKLLLTKFRIKIVVNKNWKDKIKSIRICCNITFFFPFFKRSFIFEA